MLRQLALGNAVDPVAVVFGGHAGELSGAAGHHPLAGVAGRDAARPSLRARLERTELRRHGARRFLSELMAADAVDVAHLLAPPLARDVLGDVGRAAEILLGRHLQHRVPVDRRIVLGRRALVRRRHRRKVEVLAGLAAHLGRIDEAVAARPDLVVGCRQVGDQVAALVVGHHHLGEFRRHSVVSAITHTPASGPFGPSTTPPMSSPSTAIAACWATAGAETTVMDTQGSARRPASDTGNKRFIELHVCLPRDLERVRPLCVMLQQIGPVARASGGGHLLPVRSSPSRGKEAIIWRRS